MTVQESKAERDSLDPSQDPFFAPVFDSEWNACVGLQSEEENYVEGYLEASLELVSAVLEKGLFASRDTLAMPILYNARHGVELSLKYAIDRLHSTGAVAARHTVNHDIRSHWQHLNEAKVGDQVIQGLIDELRPFVHSLAAIDGDGQELRYPTSRAGAQSMSSFAIISLTLVRSSLSQLKSIQERLIARILELENERRTGTHTVECSRSDLIHIAELLGDHSTWRNPDFEVRRAEVKARFGLSNRKFSAAVDAVRASRELSAIVGIESDLRHLSDDKVVSVIEQWLRTYPPVDPQRGPAIVSYKSRTLEDIKEHSLRAHSLAEAVLNSLTLEEFADLKALYYIGRDRVHGEHYEAIIERNCKALHGTLSLTVVHHLISKTNLLDSVVAGAKAAGRPSLAQKLAGLRKGR